MGEEDIENSLLLTLPKTVMYLKELGNTTHLLDSVGKEEVSILVKECYRIISKIYKNKYLKME